MALDDDDMTTPPVEPDSGTPADRAAVAREGIGQVGTAVGTAVRTSVGPAIGVVGGRPGVRGRGRGGHVVVVERHVGPPIGRSAPAVPACCR